MPNFREGVTTYLSGQTPQSATARSGLFSRLTSLFGWRAATQTQNQSTKLGKKTGLQFVRVDPNNKSMRELDAKLGQIFQNVPLSDRLEKLFEAWLRDSTNGYDDLRDRQKRIGELMFMYYNDSFISRVVQLVADEATQLDVQDRILSVESPDPRMAERIYQLFDMWGVSQQRIHGVCFDLELLGEAFWANKITANGVEKIIPLQVGQILERLEFNPTKVAEEIRARQGSIMTMINRDAKLQMLLQSFEQMHLSEDFAEMFETKLFGFVIDNETVVPPWTISHFRLSADHTEFYPYGRPHLLAALAPFKQAASTMTLQSLARIMSFPVTLYKVKTAPGMDTAQVWDHVNSVREQYDNIGVNPVAGQSEVYSVNTKIWVPDGLLEIDVKESKTEVDFIGDLEMYIDRIATAAGVPKTYLCPDWGSTFGVSAVSLVEQFKPFGRHVYTIQASFLEGLADLIRLHFVITGEFDYTTPFTLSMRFPAEEMGSDKMDARKSSMELAKDVIDLIGSAMGVEEDEPLPADVVKDIMAKYTFLDPTDVLKWTKQVGDQVLVQKSQAKNNEDEEGGGGSSGGSGGGGSGGGDSGMDDLESMLGTEGGEEIGGEEGGPAEESSRIRRFALRRIREARMQELKMRYREIKDDLYFNVLTKNHLREFQRNKRHVMMPRISDSNKPIFEMLDKYYKVTRKGGDPYAKGKTLHETLEDMKLTAKEESNTGGEMDFNTIREDMSHERPHIHEDFGVPEPNPEPWMEKMDETLTEADGVTDVETLLKGKKRPSDSIGPVGYGNSRDPVPRD